MQSVLNIPQEIRYPYLDQNLIEFVLSIPPTQSLRPGDRRSLMRRAMVGIVPPEILSRRTKQIGYRTPAINLERNAERLEAIFESPVTSQLGYIDRDAFLDTLRAARMGREFHIVRVLKTISLELWLQDLAARGLLDIRKSLISKKDKPKTDRGLNDSYRPIDFIA